MRTSPKSQTIVAWASATTQTSVRRWGQEGQTWGTIQWQPHPQPQTPVVPRGPEPQVWGGDVAERGLSYLLLSPCMPCAL